MFEDSFLDVDLIIVLLFVKDYNLKFELIYCFDLSAWVSLFCVLIAGKYFLL